MTDLLVQNLRLAFGGNLVLNGVDITLSGPQICGLIGPNGAGKSSLTNVLTGVYRPTGGGVLLDGERIDGLPPYAIARRGIGRTFQISRAFKRMSVLDNLLVPGHAMDRRAGRAALATRAREALELLTIDHLIHEQARALSGGQLKLLELGRLLMLDASILILDEPFAGVHPDLRQHISTFIRRLRAAGKAVIIIEHDMDAVFALSERVVVLASGKVVADATPDLVRVDPAVIEAYLGSDDEADDEAGAGTEADDPAGDDGAADADARAEGDDPAEGDGAAGGDGAANAGARPADHPTAGHDHGSQRDA